MGQRGPAPTPTKILEARGSWRAGLNAGEPVPPARRPSPPSWLDKEAKAEWRRQVRHLEAVGLTAEMDRALLAAWCEAWSEFSRAAAALLRDTLAANPPLGRVRDKAAERLMKLAAQFGFSPAARTRIRTTQEPARVEDEEERFFGTVG